MRHDEKGFGNILRIKIDTFDLVFDFAADELCFFYMHTLDFSSAGHSYQSLIRIFFKKLFIFSIPIVASFKIERKTENWKEKPHFNEKFNENFC